MNSRKSRYRILHSPNPIVPAAVPERVTSRPRRGVARGCEHVYAPRCIVSSCCARTTGTIPSFRTSVLHWTGAMRPPAYPSTTTTCRTDRRARRPLDAVLAALMGRFMPDTGYGLPRTPLLGTSVNRGWGDLLDKPPTLRGLRGLAIVVAWDRDKPK